MAVVKVMIAVAAGREMCGRDGLSPSPERSALLASARSPRSSHLAVKVMMMPAGLEGGAAGSRQSDGGGGGSAARHQGRQAPWAERGLPSVGAAGPPAEAVAR